MTREEAIKVLQTYGHNCRCCAKEGLEASKIAIAALQEPEQKKGQWERYHKYEFGEDKWGYRCPECGNEIPDDDCAIIKNLLPPNFCEQCGADMRGEVE